jgi:hypothetical protein
VRLVASYRLVEGMNREGIDETVNKGTSAAQPNDIIQTSAQFAKLIDIGTIC